MEWKTLKEHLLGIEPSLKEKEKNILRQMELLKDPMGRVMAFNLAAFKKLQQSLQDVRKQMSIKENWSGETPKQCDICHQTIHDSFVDGKTKFGPWASMCENCHEKHGVGLGVGKGQKYDKSGKKK